MADPLRALYVDDDPGLLDLGKIFLEESGDFSVTTAISAPEALRLLSQEKFDAIISDYQMPGMDGIQFLVEVRSRLGPIPFILFTGRGREEVVIQAINSGADFYLQKGGEPEAQFAELAHKIKAAASSKRADDALRKSEEKYRHLIEHSNEAIAVAQDGMLKLVNHRTADFTGYTEQELCSMPFSSFIHPDDRAIVVERYQKRMKGEEGPPRYAFRLSSKDGSTRWVELSVVVIDWDGRPATLNFLTDITERKRAEDELRFSERKFAAAFEASPEPIAITDILTGTILDINSAFEEWSGYLRHEMMGKTTGDLNFWLHPKERDAIITMLNSQGIVHKKEVKLRTKKGDIRNILFSAKIIESEDKAFILSLADDITDRKQAEKALQESEGRFHTLAENAPVGIYLTDANGDCAYVNHEWSRITGLDFDTAQKKGWIKTLHPDDLARVESGWYRMVESGGTWGMMYRFVPSPGKITWVYGTAVKIVDGDGRLTGYLGCNMDITERKRAEEQIILKNILLSTQQETSLDGILIVDENAKILNFNRRFTEIWGIPPDLIASRIDEPVLQFVAGQLSDPEVFLDRVRYLYDNKDEKSFEDLSLKDGRLLERFSAPILGEQGKYYGRVWYFRDITDRKQAEEALQEANRKLKLLSGITRHDINNQLTVLIGNLRVLHKKQPEIAQNEYLLKVLSAANRISAMIHFTKEYEEIGVHAPAWQDCRGLVEVTEVPLGQIKIINDLPDGFEVFADPLIVKVFYNLLDNAVRYGGKITTIKFSVESQEREYMLLCEDDGDGIPADEKEKIFERGFGKNTGLGLFLSREILAITGITIKETGGQGKGARFEMTVPKGAYRYSFSHS